VIDEVPSVDKLDGVAVIPDMLSGVLLQSIVSVTALLVLPFADAVMVVVPGLTAVASPELVVIVATALLLDCQVKATPVRRVSLALCPSAVNCSVSPDDKVTPVEEPVLSVTWTWSTAAAVAAPPEVTLVAGGRPVPPESLSHPYIRKMANNSNHLYLLILTSSSKFTS
jgi:hypothetical protein